MALTPGAMADAPPPNPSGHHDPMPGPAVDVELFDGAPRVWTLYPYPQEPQKQVLPSGMWPFESPVAKAARAEKGEDPNVPPHDYDAVIAVAIAFPFGHPDDAEKAKEEHPAREAARERAQAQHANRPASPPPAASQH